LAPLLPHPYAELGVLLARGGSIAEAVAMLSRSVELQPDSAESHFHLGVALARVGEKDRAIAAYQRAIELNPDLAEPHANLGVIFRAMGRAREALQAYGRALELNPDCAEVHCNLGVALADLDRMEEAVACYYHALAINPKFANAHYNLANALRKADQHESAIEIYQRAIQCQPDLVQAWSNMGMSFNDLGLNDLALRAYDQAVDLQPEWAEARWNRALTHLLLGNFERGWAEFDCRNQIEPPSSRTFPGQRWNGEDISGKTIVLNWEMGLGDSINFVRYASWVAQRAGRVVLEIQEPLRELCESVVGVDQVISIKRDEPFVHYDVHCSLMRLPQLYRSDPATMPRSVPYLRPSIERIEKWKNRIGRCRSALRVGLVWAGSPEHQNDRQRSLPLATLAPLADAGDIEFFSLQRGAAADQAEHPPANMRLSNYAAEFENMAATAALIEQLDLVISVDTSVAHLAGAMGKPVWVLLAYVPDWRWMLERAETPWYPTMRLFRQPSIGEWSEPISRVCGELGKLRVGAGGREESGVARVRSTPA
jgi:tetratricopeptide (TPR) repeat protein